MKIAMIGAGSIAQQHLSALAAESGIEIVGHVAPTIEHAVASAHRWGGRAYGAHEALLQCETIDAAWVCVPPMAHGAIEHALIGRGIPFFVEKPLAVDRETAETVANAIEQRSLIVGVGYHWRALDTLAEVRSTLARNPPALVRGTWHSSLPAPAWWHRQATSGGQIVEQATHLFDLARWLVGEAQVVAAQATYRPRTAYPNVDVAAVSATLIAFAGGVPGVFTATSLLNRSTSVDLQLICEGLQITITQQQVIYDHGYERRAVRTGNDPIAAEDRAFLQTVQRNNPASLISSYADALLTHRLCCAVRDQSHAL